MLSYCVVMKLLVAQCRGTDKYNFAPPTAARLRSEKDDVVISSVSKVHLMFDRKVTRTSAL